ncbi:MAG: hypothetical protein KIS29_10440 [Thermoplasmata archaeon]|nr:hypothetical protein [Candidatus Sysuiplasma jiujiangense]
MRRSGLPRLIVALARQQGIVKYDIKQQSYILCKTGELIANNRLTWYIRTNHPEICEVAEGLA